MKKILLSIVYFLACIFSIQAQTLYGTTFHGGSNFDGGTISKFIPATNVLTAAHSFGNFAAKPLYTSFIQASDGKLYGMTSEGGSGNYGVIFSFDPSSFTYTKLHVFDKINGASPNGSLMQASDGKFYGMTHNGGSNDVGVIFSFDPLSSTYIKLKDFNDTDGTHPYGSLIEASDGKLYGMTNQGGSNNVGVIFSFDPSGSTYTKLKDFDNFDGNPYGDLLQAADGKLYGMAGGANSYGVIFSFDPSTSNYTVLVSFDYTKGVYPSGSLIEASDGKLYGMTAGDFLRNARPVDEGAIFSFDPSTSVYTKLKNFASDGATPLGSLFQATDGKLYGLTSAGGTPPPGESASFGVIFSFDPSAATYTKLKDFDNTNGADPFGSLIQASDGKLYGMTSEGGIGGAGVTFSFDPSTLTYTKKDFGNANGRDPFGGLILARDGKLYGTTLRGGSEGSAVIFSIDPSSFAYTKLKDLEDGGSQESLIQATDGKLYGMTFNGGSNAFGVIFSFDPSSSTYTKLWDFDYATGASPFGGLMQASNGKLYGMTSTGGSNGFGVIFSFDPSSSTYTKLKDFDNTNGATPFGGLIQATDGKLYGMTYQGGDFSLGGGAGVIFSFDPSSSTYTNLKEFDFIDGANPQGSLIQASDGKLYGMTYTGGASPAGVIFSYDPPTFTYTKLKDFDTTNGANPSGSLMQASDGKLYGRTFFGGSSGAGVIFSFDPSTGTYTKLKDYNGPNGANPTGSFIEVNGCIADTTFYKDADGDGYGNPADSIVTCPRPAGYVANNTDCNDSNAAIHPGATEVCNGIDDNCDGQVDEGLVFTTYYPDADGDGYGRGGGQSLCTNPGAGYATTGGDCDDTNPAIHPGASEICDNGIDDNCNGQTDENCNGAPTITINDVSVIESQGVAVLTVTLSHTTTKPVWLLYFTKDGTATGWGRNKDYKAKFGLLVIRPGELTATIPIKIIKDDITEPIEYFDVILLAALHGDIADASGRVFISDDMLLTNSKTQFRQRQYAPLANSLEIKVMPNPATLRFNLMIESGNKTANIDMRVMNAQGKLIEVRSNLSSGQTLQIGSSYRPGTYFIQAVQGNQRRTVAVVKLSE